MAAADRSRVRACRPKVRWPASAKAVHACPTAGAAVVAGGRCQRALARNPDRGSHIGKAEHHCQQGTLRAAPRAVPMWYVVRNDRNHAGCSQPICLCSRHRKNRTADAARGLGKSDRFPGSSRVKQIGYRCASKAPLAKHCDMHSQCSGRLTWQATTVEFLRSLQASSAETSQD